MSKYDTRLSHLAKWFSDKNIRAPQRSSRSEVSEGDGTLERKRDQNQGLGFGNSCTASKHGAGSGTRRVHCGRSLPAERKDVL